MSSMNRMLNTPEGKPFQFDGHEAQNPHSFSPFNLLLKPHMKSPQNFGPTNVQSNLQPFAGLAHNLYESAFK